MAGTPRFKVHDADGRYVAAVIDSTLAASVVALVNGTVKCNGRIIWREGAEEISANESFDIAAETMNSRVYRNMLDRHAVLMGGNA